jgi:hypothetical protein
MRERPSGDWTKLGVRPNSYTCDAAHRGDAAWRVVPLLGFERTM